MMKKKILIVVANYYRKISNDLLQSALKNFNKKNFYIKIITVPGAFEIPVTISRNINKFHRFVALGCIIKGETPHFDFISNATTNAIMTISVNSKKPVGNGIITCLNKKQALARGKKGSEASEAVKVVLSK